MNRSDLVNPVSLNESGAAGRHFQEAQNHARFSTLCWMAVAVLL
jgi:hypothetical protein